MSKQSFVIVGASLAGARRPSRPSNIANRCSHEAA